MRSNKNFIFSTILHLDKPGFNFYTMIADYKFIPLLTTWVVCALLMFTWSESHAQCGFQSTCSNTNYLNFGMGSNGDAATVEYDNFVSMFHSTIVRTAYGTYKVWGQKMANDGVAHHLSPVEVIPANYPALTGEILKAHLGSDFVTIGQGVILTTTGLFAWSDEGAVFHPDITSGTAFQKLTIDGQSDGLPAGVDPLDVKMLFSTHGNLALVTCGGDVYVITQYFNNAGNGYTSALSVADQTRWHRVRQSTSGNPFLTNVIAVRGNRNTLFALKSDGTLWTWGAETYLGNNTAHAARNYATEMTLPSTDAIKMIGVTRDNSNSRPSYYVLNANGNLYSLGHNNFRQLGDWTTTERLQWVQPRYTSSSGQVMNNIHWMSPNEHDPRYAAINVLTTDSTNYNWGEANFQMLGRGGTGAYNPGIPNGISASDKILAVETGGHTSMLIKKCEDFFGYVGHRISGSMGNGSADNVTESTYTFATAVVYICGATTAEISLAGAPSEGPGGRYCNLSTAELVTFPPGGTLSVLSGPATLSGNFLTFNGSGNTTVTVRYIVTVPGCPVPDTAEIVLLTEDCFMPSWSLTKTANPLTYNAAGNIISYTISLDNTGNTGIGSVVVSDPLATTGPTYQSGDINNNSVLDTNEIWIYTATRSMTQTDVNAGSFTNTASASGVPIYGTVNDVSGMATVTAIQNPLIQLVKTANPTTYDSPGDIIQYTFVVSNPGNVTLTNVEVTDPLFGLTYGSVTLVPGGSQNYTYNYTITQADIDQGSIYNLAVANGEDPNGDPVNAQDDETVNAIQNPLIQLVKTANPTTYDSPGDIIQYTFVVSNPGNVTLTNVEVTDPLFGLSYGPVTLVPGGSQNYTYNYTITQADIDQGSIYNLAVANGEDPNGDPVNAQDDETVNAIQNPLIQLVKTANPTTYESPGDIIQYTFVVSNPGNVTLTNVEVTDPLFGLSYGPVTLVPGGSQNYTYNYTVTQADIDNGSIYNLATAQGEDPNGDPVNAQDDETINAIVNPLIQLVKTANPTTYDSPGDIIQYTFVVSNPGNVTLTNVEVTDPLFGLTYGPVTLVPGGSQNYTYNYTVTQADIDNGSIYNLATAQGEDPNGDPVSTQDDETVNAIQTPSIQLVKSADPAMYSFVGQDVEYTFVVTNTGNTTLSDVVVTDPLFGLNFGPVSLAPDSVITYSYIYTIQQFDLDLGSIFNEAMATGSFNGVDYSDMDDITVEAIRNPELILLKSADPVTYTNVGESIEYTFIIENTGNVTLDNITTTDPLFGLSFNTALLAPGEKDTFTYTYLVTQEALDTGTVYNVATASFNFDAKDYDTSDDEMITANQIPSITLVKTALPTTYSMLGENIVYTFLVTNTGNVTLSEVMVEDPLFGVVFGPVTLIPGSNQSFTYNYTVNQAALDTGSVYNLALANAKDPSGNTVNDSDDETITAVQLPEIQLTKSAQPNVYSILGEVVEYTFTVTNSGNVTLTDVFVNDPFFGITFGPVTLIPGSNQSFTYNYTVTQAALDTGSVYNLAMAEAKDPNGNTVSDSDDETINAIQLPSIQLVKSANPSTFNIHEAEITYTFIVTNTGNVTLQNAVVSDPLFGANFGPVSLSPGQSETFTYIYMTTQSDLDAGGIYNIAYAEAFDTNNNMVSASDDETVTAIQFSGIELDKTANPLFYTNPGDVLTYTFVVTNTGNVTLSNVVVEDPLFGLVFGPVSLEPWRTATFTHNYAVSQSDIDNGGIYNLASTTGEDPNGDPVNDDDDETVYSIQNPSISLDKSANPLTYDNTGDIIEYTFVVTNTGNVTLNNVTIADPLFGLNYGPISLAPGDNQTYTYNYSITQADIDNGSIYNLASTAGEDPNGDPVSDDDDETIDAIQNPSINLDKSANPLTYDSPGDIITYTFVVANTGNVTLTDVIIQDPLFGLLYGPVTLDPGMNQTYTYNYPVTQSNIDAGQVYNIAFASGLDPNWDTVTDDDDETIDAVQNPSISLDKSASPLTYDSPGDIIEYTFVVTNTGNVTLDNVTITDPLFGLNYGPVTLAPGDNQTYTHTYAVTQDDIDNGGIYNLASTAGEDPNGDAVSDDDDEMVFAIQSPSINLDKSASPLTYDSPGDIITYTFVVTNTGNVTLDNVTISDPLFGLNYGPISLSPGDNQTYTYNYTITQADIDNGSIYNLASTTGEDPNGDPVNDDDDETIDAVQNPSISLDKSASPLTYDSPGDIITYTFVVTNTGNVTLDNVNISDPLFGLTYGPITLSPGDNQTYTYNYTITQADIDNGSIYNLASTTGEDPNGDPVNDDDDETIDAVQNPSINLDKSASPLTYDSLGDIITYTFVVTNTGNVTLDNVTISDPLFGLTYGPISLSPGDNQTYTYNYTITQADIDNGSIYNLASTAGEDPNGDPVSDDDDETIDAVQNPSISLDKSASPLTYDSPGDIITYTFVVTNTGNVTLDNVTITDPLFGLNYGPISLSPGDNQTYTYNYAITQADIDNGSIYNLASTTGEDPNGDPVNDDDDETIDAVQNPSISLDKSASPLTYDSPGDIITYTFVVTNTGNVTLDNVTISDPLFGLTYGPISLSPGDNQTYTYNYTITQADIDNGSIYNLASTTGEDPNGDPVSDDDDETIDAIQNPSISLDKSASPLTYDSPGDIITYTFVVTNTGNVTLDNVTITDPLFSLTYGPISLSPGDNQTYTYNYSITQADIDNGSIYNLASTTGEDPNGDPVSDDDDETIDAVQNPSISLVKSASPLTYDSPGDIITYTFVVTNTGNVTLDNVTISDPLFGLNYGPITLSPGDNQTYTYNYTITQADIDNGSIYNLASTTGEDPNGDPVSDDDDETIDAVQNPSISLDKSANPLTYDSPGDIITYTFVVTNTGNVTLDNVTIADPLFGLTYGPISLSPGDNQTYTYNYSITQADIDNGSIYNLASTTGEDPNGDPVSDDDDETIDAIQNPSISLDKSASPLTYDSPGDIITYTFVVTNTGNVTLDNVTITDPLFGLTYGPISLSPGDNQTYTYNYSITQADIDNGSIYNLASTTGEDPNGDPVNDDDDETIDAVQNPSINLDKSANPLTYDSPGDIITYTFVVTNTGNVTLDNVTIADPLFSLTYGPISLSPGDNQTYTYNYTITQADIDNGSIYNLASTTGEDPNGDPVNDDDDETIDAVQNPSISLDKSASPLTYDSPGDIIEYTFVVTNTGNVTLDNVTITDPLFGLNYGPITLSPGDNQTYTYNYAITQADIDNGSIYNLASTTGEDPNGDPVNDDDDETIDAVQNPSISLDKSASPLKYDSPGDIITYTFVVTNTGNVTLDNVTITDPLFGLNYGPISLSPGDNQTYTYNYTITQADIDNGSIYNLASTTGEDPNGDPVNDDDDETIDAVQNPSISLDKSASPLMYDSPGDIITYTFVVTNTGNVTLDNVTISDPLFGLNYGPITLSPGDNQTYTYNYSITQADIDNGSIYNLASTTGEDPNGDPVSDDDDETIDAIQNPSINLDKSANPLTYDSPGDIITYTFVVTNTGNVTLDNVTITDPLFSLTYGPISLSPGDNQTYTYNYAITQADIDNGSIYNLASTTGEDPNGDPVSDDDDETIDAVQNPSISLDKSASPLTYDSPGDIITYTFVVTNTGNVTLDNVTIADPLFGLNYGPITLSPGDNQTYTYNYTITQADIDNGSIYNLASTTGEDPNGDPVSDNDDETIDAVQNPSISLDKSASPLTYDSPGDIITYTFVVTNTGNVTLDNVTISDPLFGLTYGPISLSPGDNQTYTYNYTITQSDIDNGSIYNLASTTGEDPNGDPVSDDDDETIDAVQNPSISLDKSASPLTYDSPGDIITYTFVVTNTGNVTLDNVTISDPLFGLTYGPISLSPGANQTYTYNYSITQADIDNGSIYNLASTTGEDPNGDPVSDDDDETIDAVQNPSISLDKSASPLTYDSPGDIIEYTFVVTNTGNVTLDNVTIADPLFGLNYGPITLSPGDNQTYTYNYSITQADIDNGSIYNLASTTGEDPNGDPVSDDDDETIDAIQNPSISLDKSASPLTYDSPGDIIEYTFVVTNTGNVTLDNVTITDPLFSLTYGPISLSPGANQTYTYNYTITQADIDNGSIYNLASTTGEDPNGDPVNDDDDETIDAVQNPSISLDKSASPLTYDSPGDIIEYTFVVTNTGNVTLDNVTISDPLFGLTYGPISLTPGANQTYTYNYTITQADIDNGSIYNLASTTGEDPNGDPVSDDDDETIDAIQNPSISLDKSASPLTYDSPGDIITYTFVVTNTGNVTLDNVTISDPLFGLNYGPITLSPGDNQTYTYNYSITQADIDNGSIYNLASTTGYDPNGYPVNDDDDETINAVQNPAISLVKQANPTTYQNPGDLISYTFTVTNTGNVSLNNVTVSDPLFGLFFGPINLIPAASRTFTHIYPVNQSNINAGSILNIAHAVGYSPMNTQVNDSDQVTVFAIQNPSIMIEKDGVFNDENSDGYAQVGETITFTFDVMNTGNVTLYNIVVNDPVIGVYNLPLIPGTLHPGETGLATYNYPITLANIDDGGIYNIATAVGISGINIIVTDNSDDPTPLDPTDENYNPNCPNCTFVSLQKPSSVSDFVWHDLDGNGIQNIGEPGIPNVYVHLYRQDGLYIGSRLTNASGKYIFENVAPGNYQIRVDVPAGFQPTFKDRGGNDNLDSDINSDGLSDVFTVLSQQSKSDMDAGFYQCVPIGELVWFDTNKNDMADPVENGINGLVVQLWRNQFGTWTLWDQTTTGHKPGTPSDDGYWRFCAPPGQYYIQVVMPPLGLVRARPNIGNNPFKDSDLTNANGILTSNVFQVSSGTQKLDLAAGFYPMAVAGNLVWIDQNVNGIQDSNEPVVEGVLVTAHDVQTGSVARSTTTDHNGQYEMDYLEQRDVYLKFTLPQTHANYTPTLSRIGSDELDSDVDGSFGSMTTRAFAMQSGMINENIDLGIILGALPVTWGNVYAVKVSNGHLVRWFTKQEINARYFVVERKLSGQNDFVVISGPVPAKGNSVTENGYEFTDVDVQNTGHYIYRIRQTDMDGKEMLSKEVTLRVDNQFTIEMYPNPTVSEAVFEINLDQDYEISVSVYDNEGKFVRDIMMNTLIEKGQFRKEFSINDLAAGVYNVVFRVGNDKFERRLIKMSR